MGARRITSTEAPLQKPISKSRRRRSVSPPTATTLPQQPMPSLFKPHVSGVPQWLQPANEHAFCIQAYFRACLIQVYVVETEFQWLLRFRPTSVEAGRAFALADIIVTFTLSRSCRI